jgi:hypothetical protein
LGFEKKNYRLRYKKLRKIEKIFFQEIPWVDFGIKVKKIGINTLVSRKKGMLI